MSASTANIPAVVGAFTLLAAHSHRQSQGVSAVIVNDCDWRLYILLGEGNPSPTNYTYALENKNLRSSVDLICPTLELKDIGYGGIIRGIWVCPIFVPPLITYASDTMPTGQALVTQFT